MDTKKLMQKIERKREDIQKFDALPAKERKRLSDQGLNPHEPEVIRRKKQSLLTRQIEKDLAHVPKKVRDRLLFRLHATKDQRIRS